jgi:diguanylate cyclase (GGDEF)-like protein/putative nucleotidyltransferase with HDIG domain
VAHEERGGSEVSGGPDPDAAVEAAGARTNADDDVPSDRGRLTRVLWWCGFGIVVGLYYGAHLLPVSPGVALVLNQAAFSLPFAMSVVGSLLAARRSPGSERRFWLLLALGNTVLLASEVYYSGYMILVDVAGPKTPSLFEALNLTGAALFFVLLMSMTRPQSSSTTARIRFGADVAGVMIVCVAIVYSVIVTPLFDAYHITEPAVRLLAAVYPMIGIVMLSGTLSNIVGFKVSKWESWEKLIAIALGVFSVGLVMWPLSAVTATPGMTFSVFDIMYIGGEYLLFMATVTRLTTCAPSRMRPMPPPMALGEPARRAWTSSLVAAAMLGGIIYFVFRAYASASDPRGWAWFSIAAAALGTLLVTRTALITVENGHLFQRSVTDPLTGLYNHRYFHERLATEIEIAERYADPLSVAVLDLDDFSEANNVRGHSSSDELLVFVALCVSRACRGTDSVCRIGGDEFGLVMPETSPEEAGRICSRIVDVLRTECTSLGWQATASIGYAGYPADADDKEELLRRADGAQYWAKCHGKNQAVRFDADVVQVLDADERIRRLEEQSHLATVRALAAAVDARDPLTQNHSRSVARLAVALATEIGLDHEHVRLIEIAGVLHDVGKIGIADEVLKKPGLLTEEEREQVNEHAVLGQRILESTNLTEILPWTGAHHERWDGKGYPQGLAGEDIPIEARMLALCDTYDAMTSGRPYRPALSRIEALHDIDLNAGAQFDPVLTDTFVRMMKRS